MAYSFRGSNDSKTIPVPKDSKNTSPEGPALLPDPVAENVPSPPKEASDPSNPFLDAPVIKVEEQKAEPEIDILDLIGKSKAQQGKKPQILASPNFVLVKKGVNKRASVQARGALSRFAGANESQNDPAKTGDDHPTTLQENGKEYRPIRLASSASNPVSIPRHDSANEHKNKTLGVSTNDETKDGLLYNSPRNHGACCDSKYVNSKVISCECSIL